MVHLENLSKIYRTKRGEIKALDDVSLHIEQGEFVVVRGHSGSGKTTLLLTIGGMLRPSMGNIVVDGKDIYSMGDRRRANFRAENIGFVFQMFHLIPYLNVVENVILSSHSGKKKTPEAKKLLERLNISGRETHKPSELSAGERQRTAIARALLNQPKLVLADEPTGNLDPENAAEAVGYLSEYHRNGGTVVVVTHGEAVDQFADRIVHLKEGKIQQMEDNG
ncbi:ATP-binding cassette domain-containing protein [Candidatus Poribacteria bacterium]|nr:ATP-binding cassette domain-containing protein [Candidatus Poribacteria bacterium]